MNKLHFTPHEQEQLDKILLSISANARYTITLDLLIQKWDALIRKIESGYLDSIYDYTNDVSTRDLLQQLIDESQEGVGTKLRVFLYNFDARFKNTTIILNKPIMFSTNRVINWWWYRIPKKISGEFKEDLITEKIIKPNE